MSRLTQHRAGSPGARQPIRFFGFRGVGNQGRREAAKKLVRTDTGRFVFINNWRDGEPLIQIKWADKHKPSAKRYRKQVAAFTQWCDYIRSRFGLGFTNDAKVEAIVHRLVPKYTHLTLKGKQ